MQRIIQYFESFSELMVCKVDCWYAKYIGGLQKSKRYNYLFSFYGTWFERSVVSSLSHRMRKTFCFIETMNKVIVILIHMNWYRFTKGRHELRFYGKAASRGFHLMCPLLYFLVNLYLQVGLVLLILFRNLF